MTTAQHASYIIQNPNPAMVQKALKNAQNMLSLTQRRLAQGPMTIPDDLRLLTPLHNFYVLFFKVEPGLPSMGQIREIKDRFGFLNEAVTKAEVLCVSAAH